VVFANGVVFISGSKIPKIMARELQSCKTLYGNFELKGPKNISELDMNISLQPKMDLNTWHTACFGKIEPDK